MSLRSKLLVLSGAVLATAVTGCGVSKTQPIDGAAVKQTTHDDVTAHLTQVSSAITLAGQAPFLGNFDRILSSVATHRMLQGLSADEIQRIADDVSSRLFDDSTIVDQSLTRIVYELSGTRVCGNDARCVQAFQDVRVELAVTSPVPDSLDIAVLVGASNLKPVTLHLSPTQIAAELDLGAIEASVLAFAPYIDLDPTQLPDSVEGRVTVALAKNKDLDYTAILSVDQAVNIVSTRVDRVFTIAIAQHTTPVVTARVDGNTHRVYGDLDFGAIDVSMPSRLILEAVLCKSDPADCGPFHGTIAAHLDGASASIELRDTLDRLAITNVSLGGDTSTIKLDDTNLLTADLNALYDRRFDVELTTFDDFIEASVARAFSLDLGLDFANLDDQVHTLPAWTAHDELAVRLDGQATSPRIRIGDGGTHTIAGRSTALIAEVLSGDLAFSSGALTAPVEVSSNQCLYADKQASSDANPFSALISFSCP